MSINKIMNILNQTYHHLITYKNHILTLYYTYNHQPLLLLFILPINESILLSILLCLSSAVTVYFSNECIHAIISSFSLPIKSNRLYTQYTFSAIILISSLNLARFSRPYSASASPSVSSYSMISSIEGTQIFGVENTEKLSFFFFS